MVSLDLGLMAAAAGIGAGHALLGPDHYVPFAALSKANGWGLKKTLGLTLACGLAHVGGGWALARGVAALGYTTERWAGLMEAQAVVASWGLILFGALYMVWGLRAASRRRMTEAVPGSRWGWALFVLFVLGPCEPLIPLLALSGRAGAGATGAVTAVFGVSTLAAMLGATAAASGLLGKVRFGLLARYGHAMAGGVVLATGLAVTFAGL